MTARRVTYKEVLAAAAHLNEGDPDDLNPEYLRGQAELICDLFHLSMEGVSTVRKDILTYHPADVAVIEARQARRDYGKD